jgi:hypothetical protein
MNVEFDRIWNKICVFFYICLEGLRKSSVKMSGVPASIRSEYFPNTSKERGRYTNLLGPTSNACLVLFAMIVTMSYGSKKPRKSRKSENTEV